MNDDHNLDKDLSPQEPLEAKTYSPNSGEENVKSVQEPHEHITKEPEDVSQAPETVADTPPQTAYSDYSSRPQYPSINPVVPPTTTPTAPVVPPTTTPTAPVVPPPTGGATPPYYPTGTQVPPVAPPPVAPTTGAPPSGAPIAPPSRSVPPSSMGYPAYGTPQRPSYPHGSELQRVEDAKINRPYDWDYNNYEEFDKKPEKKKNGGLIAFLAILVGCLVLGLVAISLFTYNGNTRPSDNVITSTVDPEDGNGETDGSIGAEVTPPKIKPPSGDILTTPEVAAKVTPSVVGIIKYENTLYEPSGLGSGFVYNQDGNDYYVITNAHVVEMGTNFKVRMHNAVEYDATLVGEDIESDIAILRFFTDDDDIIVAEMGDSDALQVGESVVAIGNPISVDLSGSVTHGIVSALDRNLHAGTSVNYIQTDAAINPGNSGGALVNQFGQVVGINTMKVQGTGYEGLGFAIPINDAIPIVGDLIEFGRVASRPVLGIQGFEISEAVSLQQDAPMGIMVVEVLENSSFDPALEREDIITHIGDTRILGLSDLKEALRERKIGDEVELIIYRRTNTVESLEITVKCILIAATE